MGPTISPQVSQFVGKGVLTKCHGVIPSSITHEQRRYNVCSVCNSVCDEGTGEKTGQRIGDPHATPPEAA